MDYLASLKQKNNNHILSKVLEHSSKDGIDELKKIKSRIIISYDKYDGLISKGRIKPRKTSFNNERKILINLYSPAPVCIKDFMSNRRNNHGLLECPFCGNPVSPDTLDHFIPKDDWPEYSIFPNNLVPQCRACAPIKGGKYYCDTKNNAIFLHPMYHKSLSEIEFDILIDFNQENNRFSFDASILVPNSIMKNKYLCSRISSHFNSLKIKSRIVSFCHNEIRHWKGLLRKKHFNLYSSLDTIINERMTSDQCKNWKTALYIKLKQNQEAMDYLHSLRPDVVHQPHPPRRPMVELEI
ncbi:TPA: HNH endonuclease [Vibrio parahaemolyticus]